MKRFAKTVYIIGLLFSVAGALYYLLIYISLDGFGSMRLVNMADNNTKIEVYQDSLYVYVDYTYYVENKEYKNSSIIWREKYRKYDPDTLIVKHNKYFPSLNYIDQAPIERRSYKLGAIAFSIFLPVLEFLR